MKDKNLAAILAIFLGGFGIHQFYLNKPALGVGHILFVAWKPWLGWISWLVGWITAISLLTMDKAEFDKKYNQKYKDKIEKDRDTDFDRKYKKTEQSYRQKYRGAQKEYRAKKKYDYQKPKMTKRQKQNPYKQSGIAKFKDYDYGGAIEDFNKSLEILPNDIATHFNIACAYSLNENAEKAFEHLDKAVQLGFKDVKKIKEHDALAYLRIQDEFDDFEANGFRLEAPKAAIESPKEDLLSTSPDLLDQLKKLAELKEKGLLTDKEFADQKKKLLK